MLRILVSAWALSAASLAAADETRYLATPEEVRKELDGLMQLVAESKGPDFFKQVRHVTLVSPETIDDIELRWATQEKAVVRAFGLPKGYEMVREEKLGKRIIRLNYLLYFERSPMVWRFIFYNTEKGWTMTTIQYNQDVDSLFTGN